MYTLTKGRKWTQEDLQTLRVMKEEKRSNAEIAAALNRTEVSISIKLKRLGKKNCTYNEKHVEDKYEANMIFFCAMQPTTVLDVYAGPVSWYEANTPVDVVTNDKETSFNTYYHEDALKLMCKLYYDGYQFDMIDLDPFGSAYDCFDLAIKMAKEAIIITYGEIGHKRWKRLDYVERYYDIHNLEDFTIENLIKKTQEIGLRNKKMLTPVIVKNYNRISRVYFKIEPVKITSQWDKNK